MPLHSSLKALLDNVLDAVVVIGRDGVIQGWNHIAETTFDWTAEEAIGQILADLIVPPEHRRSHQEGMERFNVTGQAHVLDRRLKLTALKKDGTTIPVELTITLVNTPKGEAFVGFLRDVSDVELAQSQARQLALESRLIFELSTLAAESPTLDEAFEAALDAVCELAGWPLGHAYLVTDDGERLQSRSWSRDAATLAPDFIKKTEKTVFAIGEGMPGRILLTGEPIWIEQTSEDGDFPRKGLGFESAFGFPVVSNGRSVAIFEFFSTDPRAPDDHILKLVQSLGAQVGRVFERRRMEERRQVLMNELAHRTKNLISVIQGIAYQTFGDASRVASGEALRLFSARLTAISTAQSLLFGESLEALSLEELIRRSVLGCGVDFRRVGFSGPDISLSPSASLMMSLAIHELSTNSFKYGALSSPGGTVSITWGACPDHVGRFDLRWEESGGPPVTEPKTTGFGHKILQRAVESETGGQATLHFLGDGLVYELIKAAHVPS